MIRIAAEPPFGHEFVGRVSRPVIVDDEAVGPGDPAGITEPPMIPLPQFVPKVHPLERGVEADDPYELMAEPVIGDPEVMLECMLQEFAWMGWDGEQLLSLFYNPGYPVLCQLREHFGDAEIRRQVNELLSRWGTLRFQETIVEPDETEEHEDDLPFVPLQLQYGGRGAMQG